MPNRKISRINDASPKKAIDALEKNLAVEDQIQEAATDLTTVNKLLSHEECSIESVKAAHAHNTETEAKLSEAAEDLSEVNVRLAEDVVDRICIENELKDTKAELAIARKALESHPHTAEEA